MINETVLIEIALIGYRELVWAIGSASLSSYLVANTYYCSS